MRAALLSLAVLALGCDADLLPPDAGPGADASGAMDAGPPVSLDAGPAWARYCGIAPSRPVQGEDPYCPAVHDYVGWALMTDGAVPDAQICDDGGDGGCVPAAYAWGIIDSCDGWVLCDIGRWRPCYHCIQFGDDPR